jgi:UDP-glucuronate decarboxylase
MRILITGGAGFLGSHLCDKLLAQGHEIVCLDNLFTGSKANIAHLLGNPSFEFVRHDVIDPFKYEVDQIYNLACPASPPHYQYNPIKTTKTSVMGAINCLGLAKRVKARVFQASTSEVYGDPASTRSPRATGATSTPSAAARATTRASASPRRSSSTTTARTRSISASSASSTPTARACTRTTAASSRTSSCRRSRARTSPSMATASRRARFCYVDDLLEGFVRLMNQTETVGPMNIGNPGEFTMLELAEQVLKLTKSKSKIVHKPLPPTTRSSAVPTSRSPRSISSGSRRFSWPRASRRPSPTSRRRSETAV